jgi:hypothetical protein
MIATVYLVGRFRTHVQIESADEYKGSWVLFGMKLCSLHHLITSSPHHLEARGKGY